MILQDIHVQSSRIKLKKLPKIASYFPSFSIILCYLLYIFQGRWQNYFPTISETGTGKPNKYIFAIIFPTMSIFSCICMICIQAYTHKFFKMSTFCKLAGNITKVLGTIGVACIGIFPLNEVPFFHYLSAGIGLFSLIIFEHIIFLSIRYKQTEHTNFRIFLHVIQYIGVLFFYGIEYFIKGSLGMTLAALGELCIVFPIFIYNLTFEKEIEQMSLEFDSDEHRICTIFNNEEL